MPAYGQQIIPQVPDIPPPLIPKADMTVANNVASQGAAGLAAFTNMAAQAQRARLEQEDMAQRGALAMQGFAMRREENAQEFGFKQQQLSQQKTLAGAQLAFRANRDTAIAEQATAFTTAIANSPYAPGTKEFYQYALKVGSQNPLAFKNPMAMEIWKDAADIHDSSATVSESLAAAMEAAGISREDADVSVRLGPKGPSVSVKQSKSKAEREKAAIEAAAHEKAAQADAEYFKANPKPGQEKIPYKKSFELEKAKAMAGDATTSKQELRDIDEETARMFLKQTGGDVDKARELARHNGFRF